MPSHYINGAWIAGAGTSFQTISPTDGKVMWTGCAADFKEVDLACASARASFAAWAQTPVRQRIDVCLRFRALVEQHAEQLTYQISQETGKPLWETRTEVASMVNKVTISIQAYHARTGATRQEISDGATVLQHRPHGVFAVFGPYNFPGHLPNGHIVPALIAGNTIVFKPSEYAPQTAMLTAELWQQAGIPAGVLNVLNGGRDTGIALAQHPQLDGVLFTGSCQTGVALHRQFAGQPNKMLALEMGGNNPLVVWDINENHLDAAVHHTILSAFASAGQRCTCARRLIVQDNAAGQIFMDRLLDVTSNISIGTFDSSPPPFMGPVISAQAAQKLLQAQSDMLARGATSLLSMRQLIPQTGFVFCGIVDVTHAQDIPDEEWFGPLLQVIRVSDFAQAITIANATQFGLAASLLSDDAARWQEFSTQIRAGIINWNRPTTGAASSAPFGGVGLSGNARPSAYYAADYCAYPVASMENEHLHMPAQIAAGLSF